MLALGTDVKGQSTLAGYPTTYPLRAQQTNETPATDTNTLISRCSLLMASSTITASVPSIIPTEPS